MERRFRIRLDELLEDAEVPPGLLRGVFHLLLDRLEEAGYLQGGRPQRQAAHGKVADALS
jgi:hypothetical protein